MRVLVRLYKFIKDDLRYWFSMSFIECMIILTIILMLIAIAYPQFNIYVARERCEKDGHTRVECHKKEMYAGYME